MKYDEESVVEATTTIDITNSSVQTFTTGKTQNQLTGKFDDASTIASIDTLDSLNNDDDHNSPASEVKGLKKDIVKLTNAVTLLNVHVKSHDNEAKELLGKMTIIEQAVLSTQQQNLGDISSGSDEDQLPRTSSNRSPRKN